MPGFLGFF